MQLRASRLRVRTTAFVHFSLPMSQAQQSELTCYSQLFGQIIASRCGLYPTLP